MVHSLIIYIMKKQTFKFTFGNVYAGLTVLASLVMSFLNWFEGYGIPWLWVTAPVWGSIVASLAFIGLCYVIVWYWGNDVNKWDEKTKD